MAEQITAFKARDGSLFQTEAEALGHDDMSKWEKRVGEFFASGMAPYKEGTYSIMTIKVIMAWEKFKAKK